MKRGHVDGDLNEEKGQVMLLSGGRAFQEKRGTCTKGPKQD